MEQDSPLDFPVNDRLSPFIPVPENDHIDLADRIERIRAENLTEEELQRPWI